MTWVVNSVRAQALKQRENDINFKLLQISQKLIEMAQYGSNIADGMITDYEESTTPLRFYGSTMNFMRNSAQRASQEADFLTEDLRLKGGFVENMTNGHSTYATTSGTGVGLDPVLVHQNFFKSALQECANREKEKIHIEEKKIEQEKMVLETQLKAITAEYESVSKAIDGDIKNGAIKLAG